MKYLSVCIPTYEMKGRGADFLRQSLRILAGQTFKDFEVVVSDHSKNDDLQRVCQEYASQLDMHYYRNAERVGSSSANVNNAIKHASGQLVKILFQDDFLFSSTSLQEIVDAFDLETDRWLVTACEHSRDGKTFYRPFYPKYNHQIHLGKNTISSPSVLTIKNDNPLLFDERLIWLMDCDYYRRCHDAFGEPKILNTINVVNRTWEYQISNTVATEELRRAEYDYVQKKFDHRLQLPNVTLVAVSSIKIRETVRALELSMAGIDFGAVLLIAHEQPTKLPPGITFQPCPPLRSIDEYSRFMIYELEKYIKTDFALTVQYDGYVVRPEEWRTSFLNFDFIGAPWPSGLHHTTEGQEIRVGNGGFSLRSRRLLNIFNELHLPFTDRGTGYFNEDGMICNYYRADLERAGIRFAPVRVAAAFSHEMDCAESVPNAFGFHRYLGSIPRPAQLRYWLRLKGLPA